MYNSKVYQLIGNYNYPLRLRWIIYGLYSNYGEIKYNDFE